MTCQHPETVKRVLVSITGASGVRYGIRTVEILARKIGSQNVPVIITSAAEKVAEHEEHINLKDYISGIGVPIFSDEDLSAPYASSSNTPDAMVIVPCSIKTLSLIANGITSTLTARAALATLRLKRRLILVVRETPLGIIELENMLKAARAGAVILPAAPGFYHSPSTIDDLIDFIVGKILDILEIPHNLYKRWRQ